MMQQMIVDVTGRSFADYMDEAVLKPLGMSSSTFVQPLPEAWERRAATGYTGSPMGPVAGRWHVKPELAAGGLWTTAGDLARFYIGIQHSLSGTWNPVISQSMTRQMVTKQSDDYGLGFFLGENPSRFGHNGSNVGFDAVTIALSDSGDGLTPEECERLFTPYYTSKQHGTGLGLAIAQSVISDHHGRITVSSRKGEGTTFHVEIPLFHIPTGAQRSGGNPI